MLWLGEANAASDPQLQEARKHGHANIRTDIREFAACANETIFMRLIDECGWTPDQYAELIEKLVTGSC